MAKAKLGLLVSVPRPIRGLAAFVAFLVGCATPQPAGDLMEADRFFEEGNYARALTDYRLALEQNPSPSEEERARYRTGAAYFHMKAYTDAAEALETYLASYPRGMYRPEAKGLLDAIRRGWESRLEEQQRARREMAGRLQELEQKAESSPQDPKVHYELADFYWRTGMWERSAEEYRLAMRINPGYETDPLVVGRVRMTEDGRVVPRYPVVTSDIFGNEGPVRIDNAKSQVVSELDEGGERQFVLVSGDVVNQSVRPYGPINVQVSILDFQDRVINSRMVGVGRLQGGERRRFDARLMVYGGAVNVTRFECRLIYGR